MSLLARITLGVGLASAAVLVAFGSVATWTIRESAATVLYDRLQVAELVASRVSDALAAQRRAFEETASHVSPGRVPSAGAARALGGLALVGRGGQVLWSQPPGWLADSIPRLYPLLRAASQRAGPATFPVVTLEAAWPVAFVAPLGASGDLLAGAVDVVRTGFVSAAPDGDTFDIEVLDGRGTVLASPGQTGVGGPSQHLPILAALIQQAAPGVTFHDLPSHPHYVAYAPLPGFPGWGVTVTEDKPEDLAVSLPRLLRMRMALVGAIIVAAMSLLASLDVRSLLRPLARLREAAEHIAAGDLERPIKIDRGDEVGALARAFETMRGTLKASQGEISAWSRELENRVADRTRDLNAMTAQLQHRLRQLTALHEIAQALNLLPLRTVAETSRDVVQRIAAVTGAHCQIVPEPGGALEHGAWESDTPLRSGDQEGLVSEPLVARGRRIGTLWIDLGPTGFTPEDVPVFRIVASQIAVALENAELYEEVRDRDAMRRQLLDRIVTAQEEERRRIARELHDEVGQALTALVMQLGATETALPSNAAPLRERLASIRALTSQTIEEVRRLMLDLRPAVLDDLGLVPAIRWYADSYLLPAGLDAQIAITGLDEHQRLPRPLEVVAFRLIQEAATNVLRHAHATHITIALTHRDGTLAIAISDDGRGFDTSGRDSTGLRRGWGLVGMQERVSLLGGTCAVTSRPGHGTCVTVTIPIGENRDDS